jgi:cell division protein FtsQ
VARGRNRRTAEWDPGAAGRQLRRVAALVLPSLLSVVALGGAGWLTWKVGVQGDLLRIRAIHFTGLVQLTAEALDGLSPVHAGDHLLLSDTEAMAAALRRNPWVATVEVQRSVWPPALEVAVTERLAVALVDLAGLYLVDASGRVFKRAAPGDGLDLPVVTGLEREGFEQRRDEVQARLQGALALLERWRDAGLDRRAPVSEIHVDPELGVTVEAGDEGTEIRLGQGDLPGKLERLGRVLTALEQDGRRGEVIHLDNRRHPDWVAVRASGRSGAVDGRGPRGP